MGPRYLRIPADTSSPEPVSDSDWVLTLTARKKKRASKTATGSGEKQLARKKSAVKKSASQTSDGGGSSQADKAKTPGQKTARKKTTKAESSDRLATALPVDEAQFPIVGLGASAGGLEALEEFFRSMPADSGMAFVAVMHQAAKHVSLMPELPGGTM
jgi:chemotaxis response regulator CheB